MKQFTILILAMFTSLLLVYQWYTLAFIITLTTILISGYIMRKKVSTNKFLWTSIGTLMIIIYGIVSCYQGQIAPLLTSIKYPMSSSEMIIYFSGGYGVAQSFIGYFLSNSMSLTVSISSIIIGILHYLFAYLMNNYYGSNTILMTKIICIMTGVLSGSLCLGSSFVFEKYYQGASFGEISNFTYNWGVSIALAIYGFFVYHNKYQLSSPSKLMYVISILSISLGILILFCSRISPIITSDNSKKESFNSHEEQQTDILSTYDLTKYFLLSTLVVIPMYGISGRCFNLSDSLLDLSLNTSNFLFLFLPFIYRYFTNPDNLIRSACISGTLGGIIITLFGHINIFMSLGLIMLSYMGASHVLIPTIVTEKNKGGDNSQIFGLLNFGAMFLGSFISRILLQLCVDRYVFNIFNIARFIFIPLSAIATFLSLV